MDREGSHAGRDDRDGDHPGEDDPGGNHPGADDPGGNDGAGGTDRPSLWVLVPGAFEDARWGRRWNELMVLLSLITLPVTLPPIVGTNRNGAAELLAWLPGVDADGGPVTALSTAVYATAVTFAFAGLITGTDPRTSSLPEVADLAARVVLSGVVVYALYAGVASPGD